MTIGSAENQGRAFAEITHVRLSSIARTSFSYGANAAITSEPTTTTATVRCSCFMPRSCARTGISATPPCRKAGRGAITGA